MDNKYCQDKHNLKHFVLAGCTATQLTAHITARVQYISGADPGFLLGGGAPLRNDVTDW